MSINLQNIVILICLFFSISLLSIVVGILIGRSMIKNNSELKAERNISKMENLLTEPYWKCDYCNVGGDIDYEILLTWILSDWCNAAEHLENKEETQLMKQYITKVEKEYNIDYLRRD